MKVSKFVASVASEFGNEALKGAIVLVAIDRPLDQLIQHALSLGPYHPGKPSPWSHTFLLSEAFNGAETSILDCTIRDQNGGIAFDLSLEEMIKTVLNDNGGVYSAKLKDYDIDQVHPVGVKLITDATTEEREGIIVAGLDLQKMGIHYEFLGLVRVLIALLFDIQLPAVGRDLFCSAFCQECYRKAFGPNSKGDFRPGVSSKDVTPDDIWFSGKGKKRPRTEDIVIPTFDDLRTLDDDLLQTLDQVIG